MNPITSLPQISETQILAHAKYLSEDIGYRTVGTREHALGDAWMVEKAEELQKQCEEIVKSHPGRKLVCETWRQEGSGSHRYVSRFLHLEPSFDGHGVIADSIFWAKGCTRHIVTSLTSLFVYRMGRKQEGSTQYW